MSITSGLGMGGSSELGLLPSPGFGRLSPIGVLSLRIWSFFSRDTPRRYSNNLGLLFFFSFIPNFFNRLLARHIFSPRKVSFSGKYAPPQEDESAPHDHFFLMVFVTVVFGCSFVYFFVTNLPVTALRFTVALRTTLLGGMATISGLSFPLDF